MVEVREKAAGYGGLSSAPSAEEQECWVPNAMRSKVVNGDYLLCPSCAPVLRMSTIYNTTFSSLVLYYFGYYLCII